MKPPLVALALAAFLSPDVALAREPAVAEPIKSISGAPLPPLEFAPEKRAELEADLAAAQARYDADPDDEFAAIWLGRRLAYLGRFREAIAVYSKALEQHPTSARLLRHRGHRFITVRDFPRAIADLKQAAELTHADQSPDEVEDDGQPNAMNIPRSTLHTNIYYHLGVAHYCAGNFGLAYGSFKLCAEICPNDDMRAATWNWYILSARRWADGNSKRRVRVDAEIAQLFAQVTPNMEIMENEPYHELLLHYKGELSRELALGQKTDNAVNDASRAYALGAWSLVNGKPDEARALWSEVVKSPNWAAFGFIAAEAELNRAAAPVAPTPAATPAATP